MSGFFKAWLMLLQTTSDLGDGFFFVVPRALPTWSLPKRRWGKLHARGFFFGAEKKGRILEGQILTLEMVRKKEFQVLN